MKGFMGLLAVLIVVVGIVAVVYLVSQGNMGGDTTVVPAPQVEMPEVPAPAGGGE